MSAAAATRLRRLGSDELSDADVAAIRAMLDVAFAADADGGFTDVDWGHALGGIHVVLERDREVVGHAAVVEREITSATGPCEPATWRPSPRSHGSTGPASGPR